MIYFMENNIIIRRMQETDPQIFSNEECAQGWHASPEKYDMRISDEKKGISVALTAEYQNHPAGYINVYWNCAAGPFADKNIPEIVDFGVLEKYRNKGIGGLLMDTAEKIVLTRSKIVCIGVGTSCRVWQCPAHVCKKRIHTGWLRGMVSGSDLYTIW